MKTACVVDSSVWIEIFASGAFASKCQKLLGRYSEIIVPTIVIFEVYRKILREVGEETAIVAAAFLNQYKVQELNSSISLTAADLSIKHKLVMADAIVLAHAEVVDATLLSLDYDFANLQNVINPRKM